MILYTAIKYKILDYCIESIFNAMVRNLNNFNVEYVSCKELDVGMKFKKLEFVGFWWDDVEILSVTQSTDHPARVFAISCSRYYSPCYRNPLTISNGKPEFITIFYHTRIAIYN